MKTYSAYILFVVLFILNQILERVLHIYIPILYSYFDDILAVPILVGTYQILMQQLKKDYLVSIYMPIIAILMLSVNFELILPQISTKYTSDLVDILMYILGAILFIVFLYKLPQKKNTTVPFAKNF